MATSPAELFNEGLNPGVAVLIDDRPDEVGTVCFVERDMAFANVRLTRTGGHIRLASWRLSLR